MSVPPYVQTCRGIKNLFFSPPVLNYLYKKYTILNKNINSLNQRLNNNHLAFCHILHQLMLWLWEQGHGYQCQTATLLELIRFWRCLCCHILLCQFLSIYIKTFVSYSNKQIDNHNSLYWCNQHHVTWCGCAAVVWQWMQPSRLSQKKKNSVQENEVLATKSFEEVDAYLQGHIPPSTSKDLEDVFDGETTLVFKAL